jgi:predicted esterase
LPTTVYVPEGLPKPAPLVVFIHGYQLGPGDYADFCRKLASAGYVVAAPSFPLADASRGNGLDRGDLPNEATDVSFVIDSVLGSELGPKIDKSAIAAVGHSDGADVALMTGYQSGRSDPRIGAVVAMSPDAMDGSVASGGPPLLLEHGDADTIVPYSNSQTVFSQVSAPRWFLTLVGADHLPPVQGAAPWSAVLDGAVADFLDGTIAHRGVDVPAALSRDASDSSIATLKEAQ